MTRLSIWLVLLAFSTLSEGNAFALTNYRDEVNLAEIAITEQQFEKAAGYYEAAFSYNAAPLATDLENAMLVAIALRDENRAFALAHKLSRLGAGRAYFEKRAAFLWLSSKKEWQRLLSDAVRDQQEINQRCSTLNARLQQMTDRYRSIIDQSFTQADKDSLDRLDKEKRKIEGQLQDIFAQSGFLNEYQTGLNIIADTLITDPVFTPIIKGKYEYLPTHEFYLTQSDSLAILLLHAEAMGQVSFEYIASVSKEIGIDKASVKMLLYSRCTFYLCLTTEHSKENIDLARTALGLSSFDQCLAKLRYSIAHPESPFRIGINLPRFFSGYYAEADPRLVNGSIQLGTVQNCR